MPLGIHDKEIQYNKMASKADLIRTSFLAPEKHLKLHCLNPISIFANSQNQ